MRNPREKDQYGENEDKREGDPVSEKSSQQGAQSHKGSSDRVG
ncbi:unnamed protein product [marine sediment metagenome]|uniref:Uncharacterized protein n=1 Tax=marine sediment metagenome TaxID=412755 RepID=X0YIS2_9ZZZZ